MAVDALDVDCLVAVLRHAADHRSLARAACVSKLWNHASSFAWAAAHSRAYGSHSTLWAPVLEPAPDDRARVMMRTEAAQMRRSALCHHRVLPFDIGATPHSSSFFMSALSLDGSWLAIGEFSGVVSLWDMRVGKRAWRSTTLRDIGEVSDLHLDAVGGLVAVACVGTDRAEFECGVATVLSMSDGTTVAEVPHDEKTIREYNRSHREPAVPRSWSGLCGIHIYTSKRLFFKSSAKPLPWRLAAVMLVGASPFPGDLGTADAANALADEGRRGSPVCYLWQPSHSGCTTSANEEAIGQVAGGKQVPLKLLRTSEPGMLISEQAGVMAEAKLVDGELAVRLFDVFTLRPLGVGVLQLTHASNAGGSDGTKLHMLSLQWRSEKECWLCVDAALQSAVNEADTTRALFVFSIQLSHTISSVRALGLMDEDDSRSSPACIGVQIARVPLTPRVDNPHNLVATPEWWSFERHRCAKMVLRFHGKLHLIDMARGSAAVCAHSPAVQDDLQFWTARSFSQYETLTHGYITALDVVELCGSGEENASPSVLITMRRGARSHPSMSHPDEHDEMGSMGEYGTNFTDHSITLLSWSPRDTDRSSVAPGIDDPHCCRSVRAWAASSELRALNGTRGPVTLYFERHAYWWPFGQGPPPPQALMNCASNWRFTVISDDRGIHILDWLPRSAWPLANSKR